MLVSNYCQVYSSDRAIASRAVAGAQWLGKESRQLLLQFGKAGIDFGLVRVQIRLHLLDGRVG
jgi:hypothetical protein